MAIALCAKCRYYRMKPKERLFDPAAMQTSGVLKAQLEWQQQQVERARVEEQRFTSGMDFDYEPHHYAWCYAYTFLPNQDVPRLREMLANPGGEVQEAVRQSIAAMQAWLRQARAGDLTALQQLSESGRAALNPVTGEVQTLFALCARMNPRGACPLFTPADVEEGGEKQDG